jgi:hypothetical protein
MPLTLASVEDLNFLFVSLGFVVYFTDIVIPQEGLFYHSKKQLDYLIIIYILTMHRHSQPNAILYVDLQLLK